MAADNQETQDLLAHYRAEVTRLRALLELQAGAPDWPTPKQALSDADLHRIELYARGQMPAGEVGALPHHWLASACMRLLGEVRRLRWR